MKKKLLSKLSLANTDFPILRNSNQIYVDHTDLVWNLATNEKGQFFLSRPHNFGKTLLLSTFESLFRHGLGDFDGLKIASKSWNESSHSVVRLDFTKISSFSDFEEFKERFEKYLIEAFSSSGFELEGSSDASVLEQICVFLKRLPRKSLIVLIDNSDLPLRNVLTDPTKFQSVKAELAKFYLVLHYGRNALRFLFATGVLHFGKEDPTNSLEEIQDITYSPDYASLLGFTAKELNSYYGSHLMSVAHTLDPWSGSTTKYILLNLEKYFGGHVFSEIPGASLLVPGDVLEFLVHPVEDWKFHGYMDETDANWLRETLEEKFRNPLSYLQTKSFTLAQLSDCGTPPALDASVLLLQMGYLNLIPKTDEERRDSDKIRLTYPTEQMEYWIAKLYLETMLDAQEIREYRFARPDRILKAEDYRLFLPCINKALTNLHLQSEIPMDEDSVFATLLVLLRGVGIESELGTSKDQLLRYLKIRIKSDCWLVGVAMADIGDEDSSFLPTITKQLKEIPIKDVAVKKTKMVFVFSSTYREFAKLKLVEKVFYDPLGLVFSMGCPNPSQIGARIFPDYREDIFRRLWGGAR